MKKQTVTECYGDRLATITINPDIREYFDTKSVDEVVSDAASGLLFAIGAVERLSKIDPAFILLNDALEHARQFEFSQDQNILTLYPELFTSSKLHFNLQELSILLSTTTEKLHQCAQTDAEAESLYLTIKPYIPLYNIQEPKIEYRDCKDLQDSVSTSETETMHTTVHIPKHYITLKLTTSEVLCIKTVMTDTITTTTDPRIKADIESILTKISHEITTSTEVERLEHQERRPFTQALFDLVKIGDPKIGCYCSVNGCYFIHQERPHSALLINYQINDTNYDHLSVTAMRKHVCERFTDITTTHEILDFKTDFKLDKDTLTKIAEHIVQMLAPSEP